MTATAVDPLEVDLTLLGIHQRAGSTGRNPIEVLRERRGFIAGQLAVSGEDADLCNAYRHSLAVLAAAEQHLIATTSTPTTGSASGNPLQSAGPGWTADAREPIPGVGTSTTQGERA